MGDESIPSAEQPGMQVVFSHKLNHKPGDMARTYGFDAVQVNSQVGLSHRGVSDAHDLVITTVFWK